MLWASLVAVMFGAAVNAKALGASIVAAVAIVAVYPDEASIFGVLLMYVAASLVASFRS